MGETKEIEKEVRKKKRQYIRNRDTSTQKEDTLEGKNVTRQSDKGPEQQRAYCCYCRCITDGREGFGIITVERMAHI